MSVPGISRVHGYAAAPSQRPSTISFYTITFPADITTTASTTQAQVDAGLGKVATSDVGFVNGALDRIFRTAIGTVGTVAMIGTVVASGLTLTFAIEDTGADVYSPSYLGTGPDNAGQGDAGATTALAFQEAIRTLGTVNGIALGSVTVAAGVRGVAL